MSGSSGNRKWSTKSPSPGVVLCSLMAAIFFSLLGAEALAHEQHASVIEQPKSSGQANLVQLQVPDLELTNQEGKRGKLVSEYIGTRTVALTFVYTTCSTACPVIDGIFKNLQGRLGADLGDDFALLTLTIDPAIDIPARLKEHTELLGVMPGWDYLTGERETIKQVLKALEVYTADIANHPPAVFVVDGRRDRWYRLNGFPSPKLIEQTMRQQLVAR